MKKLKKGDKVKVLGGKDRGKTGSIEEVFPKTRKIRVGGVNLYKKHQRAGKKGQTGGIIEVIRPLPYSAVALICPKCQKPTRIGFKISGKEKLRICRKCQEIV